MRGTELDVIDIEAREVSPAAGVAETALIVTPQPITLEGQRVLDAREAALMPGETLTSFLARHGVEPGQQWLVCLGGVEVLEAHWHLVRPKHGHLITAQRVPGKQALQIVAVLVLSYFTAGIAGGAYAGAIGAGSLAAGSIGAVVAAGAVSMAGALVINKLLGPKAVKAAAQQKDSPSYAISGGRNRSRQFEPMGLVLGQPYCVPDLSAQPFTYFADDEQYLWQVFHGGLNCGSVENIRIGETSASVYQDVTISFDGFPTGNTGLPALAGSVDTVAGALLDAPTAPGEWTTRTTSVGTVQIAIDLEMSLSFFGEKGYQTANLRVEIQHRRVGAQEWVGLDAPLFTSNSAKPLRRTLTYSVAPGQYEIRARKFGDANYDVAGASNVVTWTTLKSYQVDTGNYGGQARVGMQIKASGQLTGAVDELNWQATAKAMPYWTGSAWTTATTRENGLSNPGAQILLLARGIYDDAGKLVAGLGMADNLIDIESLKGFMVHCASRNFTFDYFLQETTSIGDLIDVIAAAGLGSRSWHTGRLGVIWFSDNQPVEGVFNMTTMKAKSFSVDYDTPATAEELEFQYFDRQRGNAWQSIRVLAPGVTTPVSTGRQQLIGVTTEVHAGILARFSMAQNVYQRKTVNCEIDLEHLVVRRGTVVALSHDVTQWGYGGRLRAASISGSTVTLSIDDNVPSVSPTGVTTRYVGLRLPGERSYRIFPVQAFSGDTRTLVLASAWPAGIPVPGAVPSNPAEDTIWIYDFRSTPGQKLRIAEISPTGNMEGARLAMVPESPEFWNYVFNGTYEPPPTTTLLSRDLPVAEDLRVTKAQRRVGDAWVTDLTATFVVTGNFGSVQLWASADGAPLERIGGEIYGGSVTWMVDRGVTWTVEIRPFDPLGRLGVVATTTFVLESETVGGVTGLALTVQPEGIVATFNAPTGLNAVNWSLTRLQVGTPWNLSVAAYQGKVARFNIGFRVAGVLQVLAAHKNTSGDWSEPVGTSIEILPPAQPVVSGRAWRDRVELQWPECTTTQPLRGYEIRIGPIYAEADVVTFVTGLNYARTEETAGTRLYWVTAIDEGGNRSAPGYKEIETLPSIDDALFELQDGLDEQIDEIRGLAMQSGFIRANLLYNGGFEQGKDGWTTSGPAGFELQSLHWGSYATVNVPAAGGWMAARAVAVAPGETYTGSADTLYFSPTGYSVLRLEFKDATNNVLATFEGARLENHNFSNEPSRRDQLAVQGTVPAQAVTVVFSMWWNGHSGNDQVGIRYAKLELGAKPSTIYTTETTDLYFGSAVRQVTQVSEQIAGKLSASYTLAVSAGKRVSGLRAYADETESSLVFLADRFAFAIGDQDSAKQLLTLGTVAGTPSIGVAGNFYLDGALKARMIDAEQIYGTHIRGDEIEARHLKAGIITADKINVGGGSNLIPNSTLTERAGLRGVPVGWATGENLGGIEFGTNYQPANTIAGGVSGYMAQFTGNYAGSPFYDHVANYQSPDFPVVPLQRYEYHARLATQQCLAVVNIFFRDVNGTNLLGAGTTPAARGSGAGNILNDYEKVGGFAIAPVGAATAYIVVQKGATNSGLNSSYLFWTQPFAAEATPYQSVLSPWTPSGLGTKITPEGITTPSLSALSGNMGTLSAGQLDINSDTIGGGGWGWIRSPGKWLDNSHGWIMARHANGDMFVDMTIGGLRFAMSKLSGVDTATMDWGGIQMDNAGNLVVRALNVIGTGNIVPGSATVPAFASAANVVAMTGSSADRAADLTIFNYSSGGSPIIISIGAVAASQAPGEPGGGGE